MNCAACVIVRSREASWSVDSPPWHTSQHKNIIFCTHKHILWPFFFLDAPHANAINHKYFVFGIILQMCSGYKPTKIYHSDSWLLMESVQWVRDELGSSDELKEGKLSGSNCGSPICWVTWPIYVVMQHSKMWQKMGFQTNFDYKLLSSLFTGRHLTLMLIVVISKGRWRQKQGQHSNW